MFPLYKNDHKPLLSLSNVQRQAIQRVNDKIKSNTYRLVENKCLCDNDKSVNDTIIAEKDRYGFPISTILCCKCGLVRSGRVFDEVSNIEFYKNEYRSIYVGSIVAPEIFFEEQKWRGGELYDLFKKKVGYSTKLNVIEIGCGAGGILYPFYNNGHECSGTDFDQNYLNYGQSLGLNLRFGDYQELIEEETADLLVLSHVLEHFLNPIQEMIKIIQKVKPLGYLIIEVPGVFNVRKAYSNPLKYLQNAHVYSFYFQYLKVFFEKLGLNVVYGDERCVFILQKPVNWKNEQLENIQLSSDSLNQYPKKIKKYILQTHLMHLLYINQLIKVSRKNTIKTLEVIRVKQMIKRIVKKT